MHPLVLQALQHAGQVAAYLYAPSDAAGAAANTAAARTTAITSGVSVAVHLVASPDDGTLDARVFDDGTLKHGRRSGRSYHAPLNKSTQLTNVDAAGTMMLLERNGATYLEKAIYTQ